MTKDELHEKVCLEESNICQIVVYKEGIEVYSDSWNNYAKEDNCHIMSATKSVVSLLIGIAIDKGLIKSIDDPVLDYFPEYKIKRGEKTIQEVTIKHLLTMTAPYKYKYEPWSKICSSDDWTVAALDFLGGRKGITGEFKYSTLGVHILNGIIDKTSGMNTVDFANKYLFEPLKIDRHHNYLAADEKEHKDFILNKAPKDKIWFCDPKGVGAAGYGLCLSAEDMAKIGQVYLENGCYIGNRIVSSKWIKESTRAYYSCGAYYQDMSYGYMWWIIDDKENVFAAIGDGGNVIYINSKQNLVVACTANFKPSVFDRVEFIQKNVEPHINELNIK